MSIIGILKIMEVQEDDMEVQEEAVQKFCFSGLAQPIVLLRIQRVQTWCTEIPEIL